ncbi:MAG: AMP-binding protein [Armatimonadetes bacterium]|nr:AMP-binding protein [Armatimonadota bacterium]
MNSFPDRSALTTAQCERLNTLLRQLSASNPFYAPRIESAGLADGLTNLSSFFERLPFTTKTEIAEDQRAHPPYGTNLTFPIANYTRFHQTSGTSGHPLRWLDTTESWDWMVGNWVEVLKASSVTHEDRLFFAFSFGPFLGFWTAFEAGVRHGCLCLPGGGLSTAGRLRAILENEVTVLCCTPTYAIRLGEVAIEEGIDMRESRVRIVIAAGEPGASIPAVRQRLETLWNGATIKDHHGMTEIGPVTYECPAQQGVLHILEEGFIPEVIDPKTGEHIPLGEKGELVLTNLGRMGSPLLRYRTGDIVQAEANSPCLCGCYDMALRGGILGRVDDMAVVRGVNLYPSAVEAALREFPEVAEYRVELFLERAMWEARILVEAQPSVASPESLREEIETTLRATFNLRIPVLMVTAGTLPRFELKAKRWVRVDETPK